MAGKATRIALGDEDAPERLGRLLRGQRSGVLGYQTLPSFWQERVQAAGLGGQLSERTVRDLETGYRHGNHKIETFQIAARVYGVTFASVEDVLSRRGDRLMPAAPPAAAAAHAALPPMTDPVRRAAAIPYHDAIRDAIDEWQRAHPRALVEDVPGSALFDDPWYVRTWEDAHLRAAFTMTQLVWLLADIRRADAERSHGGNSSGLAGA